MLKEYFYKVFSIQNVHKGMAMNIMIVHDELYILVYN